jgi:hypothetical protein
MATRKRGCILTKGITLILLKKLLTLDLIIEFLKMKFLKLHIKISFQVII